MRAATPWSPCGPPDSGVTGGPSAGLATSPARRSAGRRSPATSTAKTAGSMRSTQSGAEKVQASQCTSARWPFCTMNASSPRASGPQRNGTAPRRSIVVDDVGSCGRPLSLSMRTCLSGRLACRSARAAAPRNGAAAQMRLPVPAAGEQSFQVARLDLLACHDLLERRQPQDDAQHGGERPVAGEPCSGKMRFWSLPRSIAITTVRCAESSGVMMRSGRTVSRIACRRQVRLQRPQPIHTERSIVGAAPGSSWRSASTGHTSAQRPQPLHVCSTTTGMKRVVWTGRSTAKRRAAIIVSQQQRQQLQMKLTPQRTFSANCTRSCS